MAKENRFEIKQTEKKTPMKGVTIIVDKETGVNYLFAYDGYAGGLTVLLGADGKPVITKENENN